jgi:hypothetical protein
MWILPDNRTIKTPSRGRMMIIDDVQHPETNLLHWDDETLAKYGIKRFVEKRYDQKHYRSTGYQDEEIDGVITRIHKIEPRNAIDDLKKQMILQVRDEARALIEPTTWYQERAIDEATKPMPSRVLNFRIAVRAVCETIEDTIKALATYEEVIAYTWADQWPEPVDPNEPVEITAAVLRENPA